MSERSACSVIELPRATCRYQSVTVEDPQLRKDLRQLAGEWPRYGYRMLHELLKRKGWAINHKLVYRIYRAEGLTVRRRIRKRISAARRLHLDTPARPDQRWSVDFVSDALAELPPLLFVIHAHRSPGIEQANEPQQVGQLRKEQAEGDRQTGSGVRGLLRIRARHRADAR